MTIWSTLGPAQVLASALRSRGLLVPVSTAAIFVAAVIVAGLWSRRRPELLEVVAAIGIASTYLMVVVRSGLAPAERTHLFEYGIIALLASIRGETDSELLFQWLLTRLFRVGISERCADRSSALAAEVVLAALSELDARTSVRGTGSELNVLLSDGEVMIASRYRRSLFLRAQAEADVVVASEPIGPRADWVAVRDRSVVVVEPDLRVHLHAC